MIIGADGKRNTLQGFSRKEFRGKLAIAITANFINKKTEAEASVEEISGVAFIFNQKFFKELQEETRIDLENIVYYKDDTHYFVMTAKKASLLEKGVIKQVSEFFVSFPFSVTFSHIFGPFSALSISKCSGFNPGHSCCSYLNLGLLFCW